MARKITNKSDYVNDFDRISEIHNELNIFYHKSCNVPHIKEAVDELWRHIVDNYDDVQRLRVD